jgi:hypothetical protein
MFSSTLTKTLLPTHYKASVVVGLAPGFLTKTLHMKYVPRGKEGEVVQYWQKNV